MNLNNEEPISPEVKRLFNSSKFISNVSKNDGLRLAIIKRVALAHNWKISITDDPLTTFEILLNYL